MTAGVNGSVHTHAPESRGLRGLANELAIGASLATRGGRRALVRMWLTAAGLGLCVVVLLIGLSITSAMQARQARSDALGWIGGMGDVPPPGAGLFEAHATNVIYRGRSITGVYLAAVSGRPATPPGVESFPKPGELVLSPALLDLLHSPADADLKVQVPGRVEGTIGAQGLTSPGDLRFYAGVPPSTEMTDPVNAQRVAAWGWGSYPTQDLTRETTDSYLQLLVTAGAVLVLVPLLIFVLIMSRLGTAGRRRRIAVFRLVGASAHQTRVLVAGETLVAAGIGTVLGGLGFLVARLFGPWLNIGGQGFFPSDLSPATWVWIAVLLGIPMLAAWVTVAGARDALRDPLAAATPMARPRPKVWWRLGVLVLATAVVAADFQLGGYLGDLVGLVIVAGSVVLVLVLIPVLLPLLLSLVVAGRPRGSVARQLAVRHLQLDTGSAARVVAGAAVVLAGAIALQSLVLIINPSTSARAVGTNHQGAYLVRLESPTIQEVAGLPARIRSTGQYTSVRGGTFLFLGGQGVDPGIEVYVGDCAEILTNTGIGDCRDGDAFAVTDQNTGVDMSAGARWSPNAAGVADPNVVLTIPPTVRHAEVDSAKIKATDFAPDLVLTTGALGLDAAALLRTGFTYLLATPKDADASSIQALRTSTGDLSWRVQVTAFGEVLPTSGRLQLTSTIHLGLILAGLLTLLVAAAGLVLVAIDQLAERRRALTLLVASGVPLSLLRRSVMIGAAVPAVVGTLLAVAVGTGLSVWLQQITLGPADHFDWTAAVDYPRIALFAVVTLIAILAVTATTLPAIRRSTRIESLRTE